MTLVSNRVTDGSAVQPLRFHALLLLNFSQRPVTEAFNNLETPKIRASEGRLGRYSQQILEIENQAGLLGSNTSQLNLDMFRCIGDFMLLTWAAGCAPISALFMKSCIDLLL